MVRVAIEVNEACGGCSARKSCAMGQSAKREIDVRTAEASRYSAGELVRVGAKQSLGIAAVVLCYVVPLVVLVAALVLAVAAGMPEGAAALASIGATALYYVALYLFRNRISKKITFTINKI